MTKVPPRLRPGWPSASESRCRRHARSPSSQRRPRSCPDLVGSLSAGDISFDKVRAVVDVATRETDRELSGQAKERSVRELVEVARDAAARARSASASPSRSEHDSRYLRFNDGHRTMSLQVPTEEYARTKACVDAWAAALPSDEKAPLDQRRCDGFMGIVDSATPGGGSGAGGASSDPATAPNPFFVVAHVPLESLVEESGETSELAGELEHHGLIDVETVQRIACDATMVVAVDDQAGHTMYEGRARRFPSGAQRREIIRRDRHCRYPGCTNVDLCQRPPHRPVETRRWHRPAQPGPVVPPSPWGGAPKRMVPLGRRQSGAQHQDPHRSSHGLAPFAPLDEGDGRSAVSGLGLGLEVSRSESSNGAIRTPHS